MIVSVSSKTMAVLEAVAAERGESAVTLAENAIEEAALDEQRRRPLGWPESGQ